MDKPKALRLITYAALSGISIMIPVPFLDDAVADYFNRRMLVYLANAHHLTLRPQEIAILATGQGEGCFVAVYRRGLMHSIKVMARRLLDDLFFLWAVREVAQRFTHSYYHGYLMDYAFSQGYGQAAQGSPDHAHLLNAAVYGAHFRANTSLFTKTIEAIFKNGWKVNRDIAVLIARTARKTFKQNVIGRFRFLKRRKGYEVNPETEPAMLELENLPGLKELVNTLYASITRLPEDQFDLMKARLRDTWLRARPAQA